MNEPSANQFFVALLFILRCLVPIAVLFGISYLLRKMGLVAVERPEPPASDELEGEPTETATISPESRDATRAVENKKES